LTGVPEPVYTGYGGIAVADQPEHILPLEDYPHQQALYERRRKIYDDQMRIWETFDKTASEMDARFDRALFAIAAGSFGLSFAFIEEIVPLATASRPYLLVVSWACFALCLIVMVLGHLLSAETYRRQRDDVAKDMALQFNGKTAGDRPVRDIVSPCNYISLIMYIGGIICLLLFVLLNL
jgi:hypothetical protein